MEMSSQIITYLLVMAASGFFGWIAFQRLHVYLRKQAKYEVRMRHLADEAVRKELTAFLQKQMVMGDADIRQGMVFAPVPPERLEPLAVALSNAISIIQTLANGSADSLYVRKRDGEFALIDLDLDHLIDAARVMQRVAEDRRKSRSIYKGMTDDEMTAMTRAGLSQAFKDEGDFEMSNTVMSGGWDEHPEFLRAMHVLDLVFKVKGSRHD